MRLTSPCPTLDDSFLIWQVCHQCCLNRELGTYHDSWIQQDGLLRPHGRLSGLIAFFVGDCRRDVFLALLLVLDFAPNLYRWLNLHFVQCYLGCCSHSRFFAVARISLGFGFWRNWLSYLLALWCSDLGIVIDSLRLLIFFCWTGRLRLRLGNLWA